MGCYPSKAVLRPAEKFPASTPPEATLPPTPTEKHRFIQINPSEEKVLNFHVSLTAITIRGLTSPGRVRVQLSWPSTGNFLSDWAEAHSSPAGGFEAAIPSLATFSWCSPILEDLECSIGVEQHSAAVSPSVSLPLLAIADGPVLHDLEISSQLRVSFSLRMAEQCVLHIRPVEAAFEQISDYSISATEVEEYAAGISIEVDGPCFLGYSITGGRETGSILSSACREGRWAKAQLPELFVETSAPKLRSESLRIAVMAGNSSGGVSPVTPSRMTAAVKGEIWLPFAKMYEYVQSDTAASSSRPVSATSSQNSVCSIRDKVWSEGKTVGTLSMRMEISSFPKHMQMPFGVRTGPSTIQGRTAATPANHATGALTEVTGRVAKEGAGAEAEKILRSNQSLEPLELLALLQAVVAAFPTASWSQQQAYARLILATLGRPELDGLAQKKITDDMEISENHSEFFQLQVNYYTVLWELALFAVRQLKERRAFELYDISPELVPMVLARLYFILPEFRSLFLNCLLTDAEKDAEIEEWRGSMGFPLWPKTKLDAEWGRSRTARLLFDVSVGEPVSKAGSDIREKTLQALRADTSWQSRLAKKKTTFFAFVKAWVKVVSEAAAGTNGGSGLSALPWQHLPGYRILVKGTLLSLLSRRVEEFPDALVNAAAALARNPKLLSVLVKATMRRTNVNDHHSVICCIKIVDYMFLNISVRKWQIPSEFDFSFFGKAIGILLESANGRNVHNALWLCYKHYELFAGESAPEGGREFVLRNLLSLEIVQRLLNHWAWFVRERFVLLLQYRVASVFADEATRAHGILMSDGSSSARDSFERFKRTLRGAIAEAIDKIAGNFPGFFHPKVSRADLLVEEIKRPALHVSANIPRSDIIMGPRMLPSNSPSKSPYLKSAENEWKRAFPAYRTWLNSSDRQSKIPSVQISDLMDREADVDGLQQVPEDDSSDDGVDE